MHKDFILYTGFPKGTQSTKYVNHINYFFLKYGKNGDYANSHHLAFNKLPTDKEIRKRATRMIGRSKNLPRDITNQPTQIVADFLTKIRVAKKKG